jgi:hypothetical protein
MRLFSIETKRSAWPSKERRPKQLLDQTRDAIPHRHCRSHRAGLRSAARKPSPTSSAPVGDLLTAVPTCTTPMYTGAASIPTPTATAASPGGTASPTVVLIDMTVVISHVGSVPLDAIRSASAGTSLHIARGAAGVRVRIDLVSQQGMQRPFVFTLDQWQHDMKSQHGEWNQPELN